MFYGRRAHGAHRHPLPFDPLRQVAAISANRVEWAVCAYATFSVGAVWVPMYEQQRLKECEYILKDSGREGAREGGRRKGGGRDEESLS